MIKFSKTKGRGVFADRAYRKGEIVEKCHLILFPGRELIHGDTVLSHYLYEWDGKNNAIALGNGSLYNHSYDANLDYIPRKTKAQMWYQAVRDIEASEELTINYNGYSNDDRIVCLLSPSKAKAARGGR